jgi:hypothetical protein
MLDEYKIAIDRLVPTVPEEVKTKALEAHEVLLANPEATEEQIRQALFETGVEEYPHRRAFAEMTAESTDARRAEIVLEHVEAVVHDKLKKLLDSGVSFGELTHSGLFETEFTPDERYQIEEALLDADIHIREEFTETVKKEGERYQQLFAKYKKQQEELLTKIEELRAIGVRYPASRDEVEASVARFREGFSVTEPDPDLAEIGNEISYWNDANAEAG